MNEVKRYDAGCDYAGEEAMVERADGDFVRHEDYAALKDSAMDYAYRWSKAQDYAYRWSKAQDDIKKAHMLHSMQKEEIANLKEQLTATTNILKSAGVEADTVQAGVMELVNRMNQVVTENLLLKEACGGNGSYRDCPGCTHSEYFEAPETPATDAYLNAVRAGVMELVSRMNTLAAENGAMRELIGATGFKSETPATDAYLNAVRADATVEAASRIAAQAWEEDEGPGIVAAVDALEIIEREFRAAGYEVKS